MYLKRAPTPPPPPSPQYCRVKLFQSVVRIIELLRNALPSMLAVYYPTNHISHLACAHDCYQATVFGSVVVAVACEKRPRRRRGPENEYIFAGLLNAFIYTYILYMRTCIFLIVFTITKAHALAFIRPIQQREHVPTNTHARTDTHPRT